MSFYTQREQERQRRERGLERERAAREQATAERRAADERVAAGVAAWKADKAAAEQARKDAAAQRQRERAEAIEAEERERAQTAWIANGGTVESFTVAWPDMWSQILQQRAIAGESKARAATDRFYRGQM